MADQTHDKEEAPQSEGRTGKGKSRESHDRIMSKDTKELDKVGLDR